MTSELSSGNRSGTTTLDPGERPRARGSRSSPLGLGLGLALGVLGFLAVRGYRASSKEGRNPPPIRSLAVLPLDNLSADPEQEFFADGMTDALITELAKLGALRVISRTSTMSYKKAPKSLQQVALELGVDAIVEGSVLRSGERVRITAQLVRGPTDEHVWAEEYERDIRDVLSLQREVARAIARQIQVKLTPDEQARLAEAAPVDPEANELYLKGVYYYNEATGTLKPPEVKKLLEQSVDSLQAAIQRAPDYAASHAALARSYVLLADRGRHAPPSGRARRRPARPRNRSGPGGRSRRHGLHRAAAGLGLGGRGKALPARDRAEPEPGRSPWRIRGAAVPARSLRPGDCRDRAGSAARSPQAVDARYAPAVSTLGRDSTIGPSPSIAPCAPRILKTSRCLGPWGRHWWRRVLTKRGWLSTGVPSGPTEAIRTSSLRLPQPMLARVEKTKPERSSPTCGSGKITEGALVRMAGAHVALGETDEAMACLERAYRERESTVLYIPTAPFLKPLRSDPRYQDLVRRIGWPGAAKR